LRHAIPSVGDGASGVHDEGVATDDLRADLVLEIDEVEAGVPCEPAVRIAAEPSLVVPDEARLQVGGHEDIRRGGHGLREDRGTVGLGDIGVGGDFRGEGVFGPESEERHEGVFGLVGQCFSCLCLGRVDRFIDALPDALEAHAGHEGEFAEDEAVLGEDRVIPVLPVALVVDDAGGGGRGLSCLVGDR